MKKIKVLFAIICITLMATMTPLASHADDYDDRVIDVAPNVINLGSSSTWVTVHTDIPYDVVCDEDGEVVAFLLTLIVYPSSTVDPYVVPYKLCFADERGYLVAKFEMGVVKLLLASEPIDDLLTFGLDLLVNTDSYYGEQDIRVFDNSEQSGGKQGADQ